MSAFTALNGGSPKAPDGATGGAEVTRAVSDERASHQPMASDQPKAGGETPSAPSRESWSAPGHDRPPYQPAHYPDVEESHKRKRSDSPPRRERHSERSEEPRRPHSESRDGYGSPPRELRREHESWYAQRAREDADDYARYRDEREQDRISYDQQHSADGPSPTDERVGDALRRANDQMDNGDYSNASPDGDERSLLYSGQYTPERRDGLQSDPKKRKRNFSNRTKTGCLTCRKRKKKCDENKPECSNCVRGGFICAGYPQQRGTWQKPEAKPTTVQIESKDPSYVPPGAYGMPQPSSYGNQPVMNQKRDPVTSYRGQPLRIDPPQGRPLHGEDDRPTASTLPSASVTSPENKLSALSAYTPVASSNVYPTPVSAISLPNLPERTPKETHYQRMGPLHDPTRADSSSHENAPSTQLPQIQILNPSRTNSPPSAHPSSAHPSSAHPSSAHPSSAHSSSAHPSSAHPNTSGVQATAQLALSHTQFPSRRVTQKEEMLSSRYFYPFDKELVLERERCSAACWRFNNSTNPNNGVSPTERARLFREILHPSHPVQITPNMTSPVTQVGRVGENVVVEAPFSCDYGYNIQIGGNVVIGRSCTITDASSVKIGDNVNIGPNVSIYTSTMSTDYRRRQGTQATCVARPVEIEENVWIAGSAVILPGVRIGRGSVINPGSVVSENVEPYTIWGGNPAKLIRGVDSGP